MFLPTQQAFAGNADLSAKQELSVNWLYGAYLPKEAPLESLSDADRWRVYLRQGYTTYGIYIKTGLFTIRPGNGFSTRMAAGPGRIREASRNALRAVPQAEVVYSGRRRVARMGAPL